MKGLHLTNKALTALRCFTASPPPFICSLLNFSPFLLCTRVSAMTARPFKLSHHFVDCSSLYWEAAHSEDVTLLCAPSVRRSAKVGDTLALAILHSLNEDVREVLYATITQRTGDDITATVLDGRRIAKPAHFTDDDTTDTQQPPQHSLHEGDTVHCHSKHISWLVDPAAIRDKLGWSERRAAVLDERRESGGRQQQLSEACTFEKGGSVAVDAARIRREKQQRQEEQKQTQEDSGAEKSVRKPADDGVELPFQYEL